MTGQLILHLILTLWLARLCQLHQSETIRACANAVLDDQRMRELCWFGQSGPLLSHIMLSKVYWAGRVILLHGAGFLHLNGALVSREVEGVLLVVTKKG